MIECMQKLDKLLCEIDVNFEYVNSGGCACVAAMIAEKVRHIYPVMRITSSSNRSKANLDTIRENLRDNYCKDEWYNNGIYFGHVWVEICIDDNWYVLDATGVHTVEDMYNIWSTPAEGSYTLDEVDALANDTGNSWNTMFDRDQLPDIQKLVNEIFHNYY